LFLPHHLAATRFRRVGRALAAWAPALAILLGGGFVAADVEFSPTQSTRLVAIFPPWWPTGRALAAVGEIAAATGAGGFAISVAGDQPNLPQLLRQRGALWILDGRAIPACFSASKEPGRS
jgi:hypothetical protein